MAIIDRIAGLMGLVVFASEQFALVWGENLIICLKIFRARRLTRLPTVAYALVPACAKLAHFGLREEIA